MNVSPPRNYRNIRFWLQRLTACQIRSWEVSVVSRRVNVCSSWSCTEMCNKAYSTGQKGVWSSVWQLVLRLYGGHLQLQTEHVRLGLFPVVGSSTLKVRTFYEAMQSESLWSEHKGITAKTQQCIDISEKLYFSKLFSRYIFTPNW